MVSQQPPGESKPSIMASHQLPGDCKTIFISFETCANGFTTASYRFQIMNPQTPPELARVGTQTKIESADFSGARACETPDKASKPASNLSEPTCKAAARVEVSPAKPKQTTSPKPKPAASIEQSSNGAIESNLQIEPSKLQRFPMWPP